MNSIRARTRRLRIIVGAAAALAGGPTLAAGGPSCVLKADVNPASLTIPDFTAVAGGGYAPTVQKLNGAASKPDPKDGGLYHWSVTSGPAGYSLADESQPQATFVPADVGPAGATYLIRLTVTGCGSSTFLDYSVRVTDAYTVVANSAPHAVAGATPNPALEGENVVLDGAASYDPDAGTTLTYAWTQTAGPALTLTGADTAQASFIAPNVAATTTYQFQLAVSDGTLTDASTVNFNVVWTNDPPVARLSCPLEVDEGQPVTLDGSASSDSDDGIASYRWQQKAGLPVVDGVESWSTATANFDAPALGFQQAGGIGFTLFVQDTSGVEGSQDCDIFIRDVTSPAISVADITADADDAAGAHVAFVPAPTAFDAVDGDISYKLQCTPASGDAFPMGASTVACSATDSAGNTGNASFAVTVADLSPPVIAAHDDIAVEATKPQGADVLYDPPATSDKVDGPGSATCAPAPGTFALGSTSVACSAQDAAGNAATATQFTVSVVDTTPPALSLPSSLTLEATSAAGAAASYTATAHDLVDGDRAVNCTPASGTTFALGITSVSCASSDTRGNTAQGGFTVTVRDTTAPVLQPHDDVIVTATSAAGALVTYALPGATDLVDPSVPVECTPASGTTFPLGASTVTCTATDDAGNVGTGSFKVSVQYAWNGFFRPIDNLPTINAVKAGSAVPVKFSLGGNMGLGIFEPGYPKPVSISCAAGSTDPVEETLTAGSSSLSYDAMATQYVYVWKTEKSWAGSCRKLQLRMADGTVHEALFTFTR